MITNVILQVLNRNFGNPLDASVLLTEVRCSGLHCGDREFADALVKLKRGGWVNSKEDPLTGDNLWVITKKGVARITGGK